MGHLTRLARWCIFTVVLSLIPVVASWATLSIHSKSALGLIPIISHGDLLLVSVAINGSSIGELVGRWSEQKEFWQITCAGICLCMIVAASLLYPTVSAGPVENVQMLTKFTYGISIMTLISASGCILQLED